MEGTLTSASQIKSGDFKLKKFNLAQFLSIKVKMNYEIRNER